MPYPVGGYSPSAWSFSAAPPVAVPATLAATTGTYSTGVVAVQGYSGLAVSAQLSQAGSISVQRYMDAAGTIPVGAAITAALTADTLGVAQVNDSVPFASFIATIANTGGSIANVSKVNILLSAKQL